MAWLLQLVWTSIKLRLALFMLGILALFPYIKPVEAGPYEATINRGADSERAAALILAAEAICPDPSLLTDRCDDEPPVAGGCTWWCGERDGIRIPIAVTGEAWQYYQDLITGYQQQTASQTLGRGHSAVLRYTASVEHREVVAADGTADTVKLKLVWYYYCGGGFCGFTFEMTRMVDFDTLGNILRVAGDGYPSIGIF